MTKHDDLVYWATKLHMNSINADPLLSKMYKDHCSLNTEDQYLLREMLTENKALIALLCDAVARPEPVTGWKRILRRKK